MDLKMLATLKDQLMWFQESYTMTHILDSGISSFVSSGWIICPFPDGVRCNGCNYDD